MSGLHLRRYEPGDHDSVWHLHNLALQDVGAHGGKDDWDDDLHHVEEAYLAGGGEFLVGEADGRLVAMGALELTGDRRGKIKRMRVHPDYQRRGFGRRILQTLTETARRLGLRSLHLDTTTKQTAAQALYESEGFRCTGTQEYRNGDLRFTLLLYEKPLR
ncbi:MAG: GNAT family N-acetyltransferase [Phycisphaerae bacterium]